MLKYILDENEFLSPTACGLSHGSISTRPVRVLGGGRAARREVRPGGVVDLDLRRQLELAGPGLVPGQLPPDRGPGALTTTSTATPSRWSARPARASG